MTPSISDKPWLPGAVLIAVGTLMTVVGAIAYTSTSGHAVDGEQLAPPGTLTLFLTPGTEVVYETIGATNLSAEDVAVRGPGGERVQVSARSPFTVDYEGDVYTGIASFEVPRAGDYTITVSRPALPITVGPEPGSAPTAVLTIAILGMVVVLIGTAWLVFAAIRESSGRSPRYY